MTAVGSSDPTLDTKIKKWTEEGRKEGRCGSPSVHLPIYLLVHVGS